jgi:hypothetical protein
MKSVRREGGIQLIEVKYIGHAWKKVKQAYTHKEKEFNWDEVEKNQDEEKKRTANFDGFQLGIDSITMTTKKPKKNSLKSAAVFMTYEL